MASLGSDARDDTKLHENYLSHIKLKSTRTVHTFATARLTSVAIRIRIRDPDRHQNLTVYSLAHCQPSLKISCISVRKFLRKVAKKQTDKQTNKQRQLHILLLGGGNDTRQYCEQTCLEMQPHKVAVRLCAAPK